MRYVAAGAASLVHREVLTRKGDEGIGRLKFSRAALTLVSPYRPLKTRVRTSQILPSEHPIFSLI
jgi:hypothetical protein